MATASKKKAVATVKSVKSAKKKVVVKSDDRIETLFNGAETVTAEQLASAVGRTGKVLRAHLRKAHTRDLAMKNSSWSITKEVASAAIAHFDKAKRIEKSA